MSSTTGNPADWSWQGQTPRLSQTAAERAAAPGQDAGVTRGGSLDQPPVVVWKAANRLEAQIVKGRLESEGIPALIQGEAVGAIYGLTFGHLAAAAVMVPGPLAERALEILHSAVEEMDDEAVGEDGLHGDTE